LRVELSDETEELTSAVEDDHTIAANRPRDSLYATSEYND